MKTLPNKLPKALTDTFRVENNTLVRDVKPDPKDRISLEIGDSKQPDQFYPQAKIMRWDNEVNASFRYVDTEPGEATIETEGKVIKYVKPKTEFHAYELDPKEGMEDGGVEIELLLKEKPDTNVFEFSIQTKGLDFFYQSSLTQQEIDEGASRPENVVGSYAVYHATKGGMNRDDGMEYRTGKAFHIYRPKVTDTAGMETFGEVLVDVDKTLLSITIDQSWLAGATYPIIVDPTFGYTSAGASSGQWTAGARAVADVGAGLSYVASTGDEITSYSVYGKYTSSAGTFNLAAYTYSSSVPVTQLAADVTITLTNVAQWNTSSTVAHALSNAVEYVVAHGNGVNNESTRYFDSTSGNQRSNHNAASLPASWSHVDYSAARFSMYATYTAAGGAPAAQPNGMMTTNSLFWGA